MPKSLPHNMSVNQPESNENGGLIASNSIAFGEDDLEEVNLKLSSVSELVLSK